MKTQALGNYYRSVSKFFRTEKLRQAFSLQTMYLGLSPFSAPAVYALLPYIELAEDGLYFPEGGMYALIEAMRKLATELGVEFHFDSPVEEIVVSKGATRGVRVNGAEIEADAVLVNADLPYAYRSLLPKSANGDFRFRRQREKLRYTASAFMLYLGVDRKLENMLHHNFYLSSRYRENFDEIFTERVLPRDLSFYAAAMGVEDDSAYPHAKAFGVAMQLANFLRDVQEDWKRGRVYLPLEDLEKFEYTEEDLAAGRYLAGG